jgi:hypothetical protein
MAVTTSPIDLLRFVSIENEQFLISLANNRDELAFISRLQGLYDAAMSNMTVRENDMVIFQLLTFTHYHFLFSTACLMRCHLSEAFASARAAIDAALIVTQIIHDRASQMAYVKREKPFDKLGRHYRNLIKEKKDLPHRLVPELLKLHDRFSTFASHADVDSFVHRIEVAGETGKPQINIQYFQFSRDEAERKIHALTLFHTFVMILDVFSDFLVTELKVVPQRWKAELHGLGQTMERHHVQLKEKLSKGT